METSLGTVVDVFGDQIFSSLDSFDILVFSLVSKASLEIARRLKGFKLFGPRDFLLTVVGRESLQLLNWALELCTNVDSSIRDIGLVQPECSTPINSLYTRFSYGDRRNKKSKFAAVSQYDIIMETCRIGSKMLFLELLEKGFPSVDTREDGYPSRSIFQFLNRAIESGNIPFIEFLVAPYNVDFRGPDMDKLTLCAAEHSHTHICLWLQEHGIVAFRGDFRAMCAFKGNIELLEWSESVSSDIDNFFEVESLFKFAAFGENFAFLEYLLRRFPRFKPTAKDILDAFFFTCNYDLFDWLLQQGFKFDNYFLWSIACLYGRTQTLF